MSRYRGCRSYSGLDFLLATVCVTNAMIAGKENAEFAKVLVVHNDLQK